MPPILFQFLLLCVLALFVLLLQAYRIAYLSKPRLGDAFTYLRVAKEIAKSRSVPTHLNFYMTAKSKPDSFTLPPLLMIILAPFSGLSYRVLIQSSFVLDCFISLTIFTGGITIFDMTTFQATCASLVYFLAPINSITSVSLTPRPLGLLFLTIFLLCSACYYSSQLIVCFIFASLSVALLLLSQRMVSQTLYILTPIIVFLLNFLFGFNFWFVLLEILFGIFIALIITKFRYWYVLKDHYERVKLHARHGDQNKFKKRLGNPFHVIKANPWILYLAIFAFPLLTKNALQIFFLSFVVGTVLLSIFWIFGNSVNHMYFSSAMVALLVGNSLSPSSNLYVLLLFATSAFFVTIRELRFIQKDIISAEFFDFCAFVKEKDLVGNILVFPSISCPPIIYYTNLNLISAGHGSKAMSFNRMFLRKNIADANFFEQFLREAKVRYILLEKNKISVDKLTQEFAESKVQLQTLFDNRSFRLLFIRS